MKRFQKCRLSALTYWVQRTKDANRPQGLACSSLVPVLGVDRLGLCGGMQAWTVGVTVMCSLGGAAAGTAFWGIPRAEAGLRVSPRQQISRVPCCSLGSAKSPVFVHVLIVLLLVIGFGSFLLRVLADDKMTVFTLAMVSCCFQWISPCSL